MTDCPDPSCIIRAILPTPSGLGGVTPKLIPAISPYSLNAEKDTGAISRRRQSGPWLLAAKWFLIKINGFVNRESYLAGSRVPPKNSLSV